MIGLYKNSAKCQRSKNDQAQITGIDIGRVSVISRACVAGCRQAKSEQCKKHDWDRLSDTPHVGLRSVRCRGWLPDASHVGLRPIHCRGWLPDASHVGLCAVHFRGWLPDAPHVGLCPTHLCDRLSDTPHV